VALLHPERASIGERGDVVAVEQRQLDRSETVLDCGDRQLELLTRPERDGGTAGHIATPIHLASFGRTILDRVDRTIR
jgi:hypothetical protein